MIKYLIIILMFSPNLLSVYFGIEDDDDGSVEVTSIENFTNVNYINTRLSFPGNADIFYDAREHQINKKNYKNFGGVLVSKDRKPGMQSVEGQMLKHAVEHYLQGEAEILYVPPVVWDIYTIILAQKYGVKNLSADNMAGYAREFLFWFFREGGRKTIKSTSVYEDFKKIILKLINKIKRRSKRFGQREFAKKDFIFRGLDLSKSLKIGNRTTKKFSSDLNEFANLIIDEHKNITNEESVINQILYLQTEARDRNLALLYRQTESVGLRARRGVQNKYLDSPFDDESIGRELREFTQDLFQGEVETSRIKFYYSPFSGCLNNLPECPYYNFKNNSSEENIIYALALQKDWLLTKGQDLFVIPANDLKSETFAFAEKITPKTKKLIIDVGFVKNNRRRLRKSQDKNFSLLDHSRELDRRADNDEVYLRGYSSQVLLTRALKSNSPELNRGLHALMTLLDKLAQKTIVLGIGGKIAKSRATQEFRNGQNKLKQIIGQIAGGVLSQIRKQQESLIKKSSRDQEQRPRKKRDKLFDKDLLISPARRN